MLTLEIRHPFLIKQTRHCFILNDVCLLCSITRTIDRLFGLDLSTDPPLFIPAHEIAHGLGQLFYWTLSCLWNLLPFHHLQFDQLKCMQSVTKALEQFLNSWLRNDRCPLPTGDRISRINLFSKSIWLASQFVWAQGIKCRRNIVFLLSLVQRAFRKPTAVIRLERCCFLTLMVWLSQRKCSNGSIRGLVLICSVFIDVSIE